MADKSTNKLLRDAQEHHAAGSYGKAQDIYKNILKSNPNDSQTQSKLGAALAAQGKFAQFISVLNSARENNPDLAEVHINLGGVLQIQGKANEAIKAFQRALEISPNQVVALVNLGNIFLHQEKLEKALTLYTQALDIKSDFPQALNGLATTLMKQNKFSESFEIFNRALENSPDQPDTLCNLGILLRNQEKYKESEIALRKAIALKPKSVEARINLGNTLKSCRDLDGALECFEQALSIEPENADAHWNKAQILLLMGFIKEGWQEYEWRTKCNDFQLLIWQPGGPKWDGSNLEGKTILIYCEQGFGDSIQFVRYAQQLKEMGAQVIVKCQPRLQALFETIPEIDRAITRSDKTAPYHYQASLLSLPCLLNTDHKTIPAQVPYFYLPDLKTIDLASDGRQKVGIVWAGSSTHKNDKHRSMSLEHFKPLLDIEDFAFFSLQFGERSQDIMSLDLNHSITKLRARIRWLYGNSKNARKIRF